MSDNPRSNRAVFGKLVQLDEPYFSFSEKQSDVDSTVLDGDRSQNAEDYSDKCTLIITDPKKTKLNWPKSWTLLECG